MAEYKQTWGNRFKKLRQKKGLTVIDFTIDVMKMNSLKGYKNIETGKVAPSRYQKTKYWEIINK